MRSETEDSNTVATLLELAANNDVEGFKNTIQSNPLSIDGIGLWNGRRSGSKQMVLEDRTPLMIAAMYGSMDVLKFILSESKTDVNRLCGSGSDATTALHCAVSGGAVNGVEAVKLLIGAGADPNLRDGNGSKPVDVIVCSPNVPGLKKMIGDVLGCEMEPEPKPKPDLKRECPVDPTFLDIKNSVYATDEFRMYSFKVRPCSRAYAHSWNECPFVHPGENARRRDPRMYQYSCVPCPDFRKGTCRRGDMCKYAHGVFEWGLHPMRYRICACKNGSACNRQVCFFAHTPAELRRSKAGPSALDFATAMSSYPRFPVQPVFCPRPVFNQYPQQQSMLAAINANYPLRNSGLWGPFPRSVDRVDLISPMSSRVFMLAHENHQFRSLSSQELDTGPGVDPWSEYGLGNEVNDESFEDGEGPDLSWVQSLVKTSPEDTVADRGGDDGGGDGEGGSGGGGRVYQSTLSELD